MPEPAPKKANRPLLRWMLRVTISGSILAIIFWLLPLAEVRDAITAVPLELWGFVLGIFFLGHGIAAIKWWLLTNKRDDIPIANAIKAHFAGLAANLCLPGVAGGDVLRAGMVLRGSANKAHVTVGSLMDRLLDVFALLILSAAGALLSVETTAISVGPLEKIAIFLVVVSVLTISAVYVLPRLPLPGPLRSIADQASAVIRDFAKQPGRLSLCLGLSIGVQAVFVQLNILLAEAAGVEVTSAAWFFAWPLAKLVATVPISLAGLGVREASLAVLLAPFGGNAAQIVAVGLAWQAVLFTAGALSAIIIVFRMNNKGSVTLSPAPTDGPDNSSNTGNQ